MEQDRRASVTQRVVPTGPYTEAMRRGEFAVAIDGDCQNIVNPLLDGTKYLPHSVSRCELRKLRRPGGNRTL